MSTRKPQSTQLVEADTALEELLGTLLAEVPEYAKKADQAKPRPGTAVPPAVAEPPPAQLTFKEPVAAPITSQQDATDQRPQPDWSRQGFKALVVRIGGLRMALPLVMLNRIAKLTDELSPTVIPGQPGWHRGVTRYRDRKVVVVDLPGLLAMRAAEQAPAYLLLIGDGCSALQCDALEEPITVMPDKVHWRHVGDRRDWLLGMLTEHMCLLLDCEGIAQRIA
jgi:purine-binding chemotaxis protein CheW